MRIYFNILSVLVCAALVSLSPLANASYKSKKHGCCLTTTNPVETRVMKENTLLPDYFAVTLHKPNYFLPYYYTGSPANKLYFNNTPNNEQIKHGEVKFQLSLKAPLWRNIFNRPSTLYVAYTQLSYWQLYNKRAFFRSNDYEPELFLANQMKYGFLKCWELNFLNLGVVHQSNGFGNGLQRGWDRVYLEAIASTNNFMVSLKPWIIYSTNGHNRDIGRYMGYGTLLMALKFHNQVVSLQTRSILEHQARYATGELTWSFPIIPYFRGYLQVFSGYGQSLIEYNHRTNSAGIGVALNDWI